jgi:hypothetical protein
MATGGDIHIHMAVDTRMRTRLGALELVDQVLDTGSFVALLAGQPGGPIVV